MNKFVKKCNFMGAILCGGCGATAFISGFYLMTIDAFNSYDEISELFYIILKYTFIFSDILLVLSLGYVVIDLVTRIRKKYFDNEGVSLISFVGKTIGMTFMFFVLAYCLIGKMVK